MKKVLHLFRIGSLFLFLSSSYCLQLMAQEADIGIAMPLTITGEALRTQRLRTEDPHAGTVAAAFRGVFSPTLKLGTNWFAYSAIQVSSTPFFYYDSYEPERKVETKVLQAFVGYSRTGEKRSISLKAGKLTSAFGSFPLRYDDTANWLLDQPLSYGSYLKIRPDQLPCGVGEFSSGGMYPAEVDFHCGGAEAESYGITPVALYGLPGSEVDFSIHRLDGRVQITNSSPARPQSLLSHNQSAQWTAGAGYTIRQGFRIGFSTFRGPYLESAVGPLLPDGKSARDFPATGTGVDVQWARGRWSARGEWQRFQFNFPFFKVSPAVAYGYVEIKAIINPRLYGAIRSGYQAHNRVQDLSTRSTETFLPNRQSYECAVGYRLNRRQLLKVGYEWLRTQGTSGTGDNVFGIQLVTSIDSLSKALK